jgi:hypothetical protein
VGGASARPSIGFSGADMNPAIYADKVLYNQNSNPGGLVLLSQNFTSGTYSSYSSQAADDFVVPKNHQWTVSEVDVTGLYDGSGPATSEDVYFYADNEGMPGSIVNGGSFSNLKGSDNYGSFSINLGKKGVKLKAGTYWVSVVANCGYTTGCGLWLWEKTINSIQNSPAMWQNPSGGAGFCPTWGSLNECWGTQNSDLTFDLQGESTKVKKE